MKKFHKAATLMLAAAMAATAFAGCGDNGGSSNSGSSTNSTGGSSAASGETVALTAAFPGQESNGQAAVLEAVNKAAQADGVNVTVTVKFLDDYWNKLALAVAGGESYDIAWAHSSTLSDLVSKKVYQPIDEALQSNGQDLLANTPDYVLKGGTVNEKVYALPRVIPMTAFNNTWNIRGDIREKYNIPEIKTIEDLEAYFDAILANEPDMYAIVGSNMQPMYPVYADYYFPIGDGGVNPVYIDPTDSSYTVKSFWDSEAFTKVCEKRKEWYDKGYLPVDSSNLESEDTGFDYGMVGCVAANLMRASERIDTFLTNVPDGKIETVLLEPETRHIYMAGDNMLAVPSTSKHVNEAVAFINWFKKDQENYDLWSYGVEGTNYTLTDGAVDVSATAEANIYSMNTWMWNDIRLARFSANYPKEDIETLKTWDEGADVTPFVGFTVDQSKIKSQISQVTAVMNEYAQNLGKGVTDINEVRDEIMEKMNAAGLQDIITEVQAQVDAYVK
ncbi:MAG: ABC transporter substrate-binding protein [Candidatus Merdivicinus sp.]|jgi:putative aldouronate transport system substrate-binding protein